MKEKVIFKINRMENLPIKFKGKIKCHQKRVITQFNENGEACHTFDIEVLRKQWGSS